MKILSIDSTAQTSTCAITEDGRILACASVRSELNHTETLLPLIDECLSSCNITLDDVGAFALSNGPGSFAGVRIGVSLVKGLAFGRGKVCVALSTLEALAYNLFPLDGIYCPVMDARRGQVYNALFRRSGEAIERLCPDRAVSLEDLSNELQKYDCDIYLCGDGYSVAAERLSLPRIKQTPILLRDQSAASVGLLAGIKLGTGEGVCTDKELKASYLRLPQAERERLEKLKDTKEN